MYALTNCTIYTTEAVLTDHAVIIENDLIKNIVVASDLDSNIKKIDLNGANLSPGFIDLQLNGCGGVMLNGAETQETLKIMQATNLKSGTTSYLPTFITDADEGIKRMLKVTRHYMDKTPNEVLGLHLEGPYLSIEKKGIHRPEFIRKPDAAMIEIICENSDIVSMLTLAPENSPIAVIKQLSESNIVVSMGHTNATYAQAKVAIDNGVSCATHLFNAMSAIAGREPGVVGAIYDNDIYAGVIVDGFHVAYENVRISKKIMGEKLFLVTDATAPAGANIDSFDFVGTTVFYKEGKCLGTDGTLGGSAVTMIESIEQTVKFVGVELKEAIRMATLYPAKAISVDNRLGSIKVGKVANLAIFNNDYKVTATVVNGVYKAS
ncbi:N-acetylglucosamine-6-phosphate deacetylase [Psychromonas hadalis]|uniref:N-acetylglucosamine-6-phosphate deacetylase n=1 Tax=Psychromonas hadalis TaxID=211669 RepID=UPI0003B5B9A5|nr:N-acetylglucosamine-6-phosphate deacetylase [Psychromonas hadalis]